MPIRWPDPGRDTSTAPIEPAVPEVRDAAGMETDGATTGGKTGPGLIAEGRVPEGYVAFGWHRYNGAGLSAQAVLSGLHLSDASQGTAPWQSVCGRKRTGRGTKQDSQAVLLSEWRHGERKPCRHCFRLVAEHS